MDTHDYVELIKILTLLAFGNVVRQTKAPSQVHSNRDSHTSIQSNPCSCLLRDLLETSASDLVS